MSTIWGFEEIPLSIIRGWWNFSHVMRCLPLSSEISMIDVYYRVKIDAFRYGLKRLEFTAAFTYKGNIVLHAGKLSIVRHRGVEALRFLMESLYVYPCISVDFPNPIISSRVLFRFDYPIGILTDTVSLSHQF